MKTAEILHYYQRYLSSVLPRFGISPAWCQAQLADLLQGPSSTKKPHAAPDAE